MKFLGRNEKDKAGQACCVNHHRKERFDEAARRIARDRVAPAVTLKYR